jgi:hypothetical protein
LCIFEQPLIRTIGNSEMQIIESMEHLKEPVAGRCLIAVVLIAEDHEDISRSDGVVIWSRCLTAQGKQRCVPSKP